MGQNVVCLIFFCERESKITLLKLIQGEQNFLNSFWSIFFEPASLHNQQTGVRQSNDRLTKLDSEFDYVRLSLEIELLHAVRIGRISERSITYLLYFDPL